MPGSCCDLRCSWRRTVPTAKVSSTPRSVVRSLSLAHRPLSSRSSMSMTPPRPLSPRSTRRRHLQRRRTRAAPTLGSPPGTGLAGRPARLAVDSRTDRPGRQSGAAEPGADRINLVATAAGMPLDGSRRGTPSNPGRKSLSSHDLPTLDAHRARLPYSISLEIGLWAQLAPRSFFDHYPGLGRAWVGIDGPQTSIS